MEKTNQTSKPLVIGVNNLIDRLFKLRSFIMPKEFGNEEASKPSTLQTALWVIIICTTIILSLLNYQSYQFGTHYDDARYVILAQSLVHSDQYGMINQPGEPGVTQYPFGYPLILAPIVALFPGNWDALKLLSLFTVLLNGSILFWAWKWFSRSSYWWGLAVTGLYLFSPMGVVFTRRVMSEPVFILFCFISIILAERAIRKKKQNIWWLVLMSVSLMFALFIRTIGITLILGIFFYWLVVGGKRFWKEILAIVILIIVMVSFVVGTTSVSPSNLIPTEYLSVINKYFNNQILTGGQINPESALTPEDLLSSNVNETPGGGIRGFFVDLYAASKWHIENHLIPTIYPIGGGEKSELIASKIGIPALPAIIAYVTFVLVIIGYFRWILREGLSAFSLFPLFYIGVLMIWGWEDPRFLYPVLPQLFFGLLLGIGVILTGITSHFYEVGYLSDFVKWCFGCLCTCNGRSLNL